MTLKKRHVYSCKLSVRRRRRMMAKHVPHYTKLFCCRRSSMNIFRLFASHYHTLFFVSFFFFFHGLCVCFRAAKLHVSWVSTQLRSLHPTVRLLRFTWTCTHTLTHTLGGGGLWFSYIHNAAWKQHFGGLYNWCAHTRTKKTSEHFFCSPDSVVAVSDPEIVQAVNFMIPALKIVMKHLYGDNESSWKHLMTHCAVSLC